jgi:hypothetical protein
MAHQQSVQSNEVVQAFRHIYTHITQKIETLLSENSDSTILARILDEITEYRELFLQVCMVA